MPEFTPLPAPAEEVGLDFLAAGGEMGALMRAFAWETTGLGLPTSWPQSLRTAVSILLRAKFPMFLWWGPDLIQFYNDAYRPSLGNEGKHPTALGQRGEACWPEIWPIISPLIAQVQAGGEATWSQDQLIPIYRNGRLEDVYWTFSYCPVLNEAGQVGGVLTVCTETTAQVLAVRQLRLSDQRFQNLVREASMGIIVLSGEDRQVRIVNEAYARQLNRTPAQLLNQPLFDLFPELEPSLRPLLAEVWQRGESVRRYGQPYALPTPGEAAPRPGFLDLVYQPYRETDGTITGVMILSQDVTQRQLAEELVRQKNAELTRLNNDLDNFIYAASHDLKAPISNIEGLLDLLTMLLPPDTARLDSQLPPVLARMQGAVERFKRTIDHLTDVSKLQTEFARPAEPVALAAVVEDVRQDLLAQLAETGAQLAVAVGDCRPRVFSEKNLRSLVYNLLSNALKYRHPDRVPRIRIQCAPAGPHLVLTVQDNGLGLDEQQQTRLFYLFQRLHTHVEGSGVGLYMVKKIVENIGGTIAVQSTPNVGTTFTLTFPA